jgi:acyl-CoA thioesterase I
MMNSDIDLSSSATRTALSRRAWLRHCSAWVLAGVAGGVSTVAAQGNSGPAQPARSPAPGAGAAAPRLLIVGDSLSAEYGIPRGSGWVALLEQRLQHQGLRWEVVNASISGDTTSGGRTRLPALLRQHQPALVIIELGGNDALRGLPLAMTEDNLRAMTRSAQQSGARVLLAGMQVPPNYGRRYSDDFFAIFARVAKAENAALVPFLLAGVADVPNAERWFQPDRIHPVADAQPKMLDNVWPVLRPLLG